jgi:hypothetical protein
MTIILSAGKHGTKGMVSQKPFVSHGRFSHSSPHGTLVNPQQTLFNDAIVKLLQSFQIRIFVFVTGLTRIGNLRILHRVFGQQGHKHMGMRVTGFRASGDAGHVATDAVSERMYGMRQVIVNHFVAYHTLLGTGTPGLELSRGYAQLMHIMAGCASNAFLGM